MSLRVSLKNWVTVLLFLLAIGSAANATIVYVDADASVGGDGSSWAAAFKFLQDALDDAASGDEIQVSQGIYTPDSNSDNPTGSGNRGATFHLKNGVALRGGYAGLGEPDPNERDIELYDTILRGDLAGDDGPNFANNGENSYHVVTTGSDTDETAVLDGLTITAGNADDYNPYNSGGGMYNDSGSPTVTNCAFIANSAGSGGGIYSDSGNPTVTKCTFIANSAGSGGGIYNSSGSPTITNCRFIGNSMGYGGGIYNLFSNQTLVTDCTFIGNSATASFGGGMLNVFSNVTVTNCTFSGNSATYGGAMRCGGNTSQNITVTNCTFVGNSASTTGGGISNDTTTMTATNCIFIGNTSDHTGGGMGGEDNGETLVNCTFIDNYAGNTGGAIWYGHTGFGEPSLTNCILWGNIANEGPQIALTNSVLSVDYCNIQGGLLDIHDIFDLSTIDWGAGNIETDPCFVDFDNDDCHLQWDSLCINAGDPSGDYTDQVDIDDEPRVMSGRVDIGADEVGEKQADFIRDGIINLEDFSVFSRSWMSLPGQMNWYVLCDLYEDEQIGLADLAGLVDDWLWQAGWYEP